MASREKAMDPRLVDIGVAVIGFGVFLVLIVILPAFLNEAVAYLTAIIAFVIVLSAAGWKINQNAAV